MGTELALACAPSENKESSLTEADLKGQRKTVDSLGVDDVWIGSSVAERLRLGIGSTVPITGKTFTITHVLPETGTIDDNRVFMHLHTAQALLGIPGQVSNIEIMGCCSEISDGLLGKLRNILPDTRITTIGHIVNTQIETNTLMAKIALVLLVIIILVGSFSIGNYMWANVEERRKEIGTLITIGWGRRHIYWLFLSKAVMLGLAGGVLGYVAGTLAAAILGPYLAGLDILPVVTYLWWSIVVAVVIALAGSWYPTFRAARIDPAVIMQEI